MSETPDLPLGGVPPATRVLLRHAPLQVAVAEVRWSRVEIKVDEDRGLDLRASMAAQGLELTRIEPVRQQQVRVEVGPEGPLTAVDTFENGVRLTSSDGTVSVSVMPDSLVVQCNSYHRYRDSLAPQIAAAAAAVRDIIEPHLVQRVGLRYINHISDPDANTPHSWRGRVASEFLGPLLHPELGARVTSAQQQVELQLDATSGSIVRHGPFKDASAGDTYAYLLDIDVFDTRSERFDIETVAVVARALNRTAAALFQQIVSQEWRDTMGPYTEPLTEKTGAREVGDAQGEAQ